MGLVLIILAFGVGYSLIKEFLKLKRPLMVVTGAFLIGTVVTGSILYLLDLFFIKSLHNYVLGLVTLIIFGRYPVGFQ